MLAKKKTPPYLEEVFRRPKTFSFIQDNTVLGGVFDRAVATRVSGVGTF